MNGEPVRLKSRLAMHEHIYAIRSRSNGPSRPTAPSTVAIGNGRLTCAP